MIMIEDPAMLCEMVRICRKNGIPFRVFGTMSNVLVSDSGFDGVVLLNRKGRITHSDNDDGSAAVTAGSGAAMAGLVKYCVQNGLSGMEWAAGLPGTVGGAVYGNAGAFGSDISAVFQFGRFVDGSGEIIECSDEELAFGYRTSALMEMPAKLICWDRNIRRREKRHSRITNTVSGQCSKIRRDIRPEN